jgi:acyl-CoA thioester hydrolase
MMEEAEPLVWVVRRMDIGFLRPAKIEQPLTVRTSVRELTGARMRLDQAVLRAPEPLVKADVEVCIVTLDGRPRRVPDSTRKKLEFFLADP